MSSPATKQVAVEFPGLIKQYTDGTVERLCEFPTAPPNLDSPDPKTGVSSKDVTISDDPKISARIYLPKLDELGKRKKLPVLVYFHAGAFCLGSAFSALQHGYLNSLSAEAEAIAVSVEYRLAPEHPLPAAYEDSWDVLQWVACHFSAAGDGEGGERWILEHGDLDRLFIGGDSAGGNIVHNLAMRAGEEGLFKGEVKIKGGYLLHPFFWGSNPVGKEPKENHQNSLPAATWRFVYPSAPGGLDNAMFNPGAKGAPPLARLKCDKLLICVAGKDQLRERGVWYYELVKESGWKGEIELYEVEDEDHCFHLFNFGTEKAETMIKRLASFIMS
ncbi:unnamed protein product [Linum trigynum]|uniref:Alpha/beta hydrolase fold-3 domain-containing protein n=1 Tax=Linum trigynum TaxID=586398 RepID=A0AAV2FFL6_9ROSI